MDRVTTMHASVKVAELGSFVRAADALGMSRTMATVYVGGWKSICARGC